MSGTQRPPSTGGGRFSCSPVLLESKETHLMSLRADHIDYFACGGAAMITCPMGLDPGLIDDLDVPPLAVIVGCEADSALDGSDGLWGRSIYEGHTMRPNMVRVDMNGE